MPYSDLPTELQDFLPSDTLGVPPSARSTITAGWKEMAREQQQRLIAMLREEPDGLKRALTANSAALMVLLGQDF